MKTDSLPEVRVCGSTCPMPSRHPVGTFLVLASGLLLALGGCTGYAPKPLDIDATHASWVSRSPSDPSVRAFAERLALSEATVPPVGVERRGFDPGDGLALHEAEAVALVFNPDLRLARLEANVTRATARYAGLWQDPSLGMDFERIVSGADGANPWVAGSAIGITIPLSGRLEAEKSRAGAAHAADLDRVVAKEWKTRSMLRELWIEWSAARMRLDLAEELTGELRELADLVNRQERAGSMTRVETRLFLVEVSSREADRISNASRVREYELQLRSVMGLMPDSPLVLVPTVVYEPRTTDGDQLRKLIEASNPELLAVRTEYEVSEQMLRAEIRRQYPDLTIGPGYGTDQGDDRVQLGISLPLPLWNRNQQGIAEAIARREVAQGRFEATYEHIFSELAMAITRHESGRSQRALIESSVIPLADEQEADVRRIAALGRVDPLMLLEAIKARHAAKVRIVEAMATESMGAIRMDMLIGPPVNPVPALVETTPQPNPSQNSRPKNEANP